MFKEKNVLFLNNKDNSFETRLAIAKFQKNKDYKKNKDFSAKIK